MERACLELLERASSQVDFVVISARLDPRVRPLVRWHRIPIPQRPFPLKFAVYYLLAGMRLAFEHVDLVHTVGAIVPNKVDVASVHFCHAAFQAAATGVVSHASAPRRANARISHHVALATERWSYRDRRVQRLAPVSLGVANELHSFYPGIDTEVTVNGVDHDRFRPNPDTYHAVRRRLEVATGKCVALFVGGDWDRKGLGVAIRGLAHARRKGADVTLWVVGPGDRSRFEALAAHAGVAEDVRFLGHRGDTEVFYQAADIFVLPTLYETFCLAAFEAAACGLPLIVTKVHGASQLVGGETAGITVDRKPEAVGAALSRLSASADLRTSLGAVARSRASAFTWGRSVESVLALYEKLLEPVQA
jgi:glycosyltransferase involved in cell wall biosynthesis